MTSSPDADRRAAARPAKPARRSQAERSADTKARLLEAAIGCLHRLGYSGTTTAIVADEAGVSRGRLTHHYHTKIDLMEAVVREVFEREMVEYDKIFGAVPREQAFYAFPDATWAVLSQPPAMAVTEIMLASRSDPALAERLRDVQEAIEAQARKGIIRMMADAGLEPRADGNSIHRLFVAAARGLAIDALFTRRPHEIEGAVTLLREVLETYYPRPARD